MTTDSPRGQRPLVLGSDVVRCTYCARVTVSVRYYLIVPLPSPSPTPFRPDPEPLPPLGGVGGVMPSVT